MPPVPGSELAEADALIISSPIALDVALDMALALAEALPIMSSSFIIWSLCIFATAAGAKTTATNKAGKPARASFLIFLLTCRFIPACCT
jgi:hypothetical protein